MLQLNEETSNTESELLRLVSLGNSSAFKKLVDIFWNKVFGSTLALTKNPQTAEELTQDIFLKIWNQRETLAEIDNFGVYIYVTGRNQVISAMRKKIMDTSFQMPGNLPEDINLPHLQLEMKDTYRIILEGIDHLPPTRQKVFKMSRMQGLSYDEIARELQISRNTVKEHIVNALNFLRNFILTQTGKSLLLAIWISFIAWIKK